MRSTEPSTNELKLAPLADYPRLIGQVAELLNREWGHLPPWSDRAALVEGLQQRLQTGQGPFALVAQLDRELVGSGSIKINELADMSDKEFWIGDVIVGPKYRGRGVGAAIMRGLIEYAKFLGLSQVHLYTPDQQDFYRRRGWHDVGQHGANGEDNTVMRCELVEKYRALHTYNGDFACTEECTVNPNAL